MIFNRLDRYEYELMELEEKDITIFNNIVNSIEPDDIELKVDKTIVEHTMKTALSTYIGNIILNKDISFDPVDNSIKLYLSKEHVEKLCKYTKTGIVVFVSKINNNNVEKNISGWYDEDIFLNNNNQVGL